jgi:hypothetical protein
MLGEEYKLWSSWLCNCLNPLAITSLLGPTILLSTPFLKTLSLCSSHNVKNQVSYLYKTTDKIMELYILVIHFYTADKNTQDSVLSGSKDSSNLIRSSFLRECNFDLLSFPNIWSPQNFRKICHPYLARNLIAVCIRTVVYINVIFLRKCHNNAPLVLPCYEAV